MKRRDIRVIRYELLFPHMCIFSHAVLIVYNVIYD